MKKLRKDIVKHLELKGNYDATVDDYMIDMLIENLEYLNTAKMDIELNGLVQQVTGRNNAVYTKINPALGCYQMCQRNIHQAAAKLGINRSDRLKLKLIESKEQDKFDELFED